MKWLTNDRTYHLSSKFHIELKYHVKNRKKILFFSKSSISQIFVKLISRKFKKCLYSLEYLSILWHFSSQAQLDIKWRNHLFNSTSLFVAYPSHTSCMCTTLNDVQPVQRHTFLVKMKRAKLEILSIIIVEFLPEFLKNGKPNRT